MDVFMITMLIASILLILGFVYMAFKMFENSKPTVESIVLLAILVAIAVLGRLLLLSIPGIQAGSFIIIMVGVVYGREEGFLVGALAALVGDLFVGIGYWAVFQMLGWGLMGATAGILAERFENPWFRVVFGFAWGYLYGWITDISAIFYTGIRLELGPILALYANGIAYDFAHGMANAVLLFVFYDWFKKIFLRAKTKYLDGAEQVPEESDSIDLYILNFIIFFFFLIFIFLSIQFWSNIMTKDGNFELIFETCNGDEVFRDESNVVVRFAQKRNGIVTSWINAGYREDLEAVFNHQLSQETLDGEESEEIKISDYLKGLSHELAVSLDLDENRISGLVTSAKMTNVGISTERFRKLEVTAISTAGTNVNAGSAGDPASYYEENGHFDLDINQSAGDCSESLDDEVAGGEDNRTVNDDGVCQESGSSHQGCLPLRESGSGCAGS